MEKNIYKFVLDNFFEKLEENAGILWHFLRAKKRDYRKKLLRNCGFQKTEIESVVSDVQNKRFARRANYKLSDTGVYVHITTISGITKLPYYKDLLSFFVKSKSENNNYTKVPTKGYTHYYGCSPAYGHSDYNKFSFGKIGNKMDDLFFKILQNKGLTREV